MSYYRNGVLTSMLNVVGSIVAIGIFSTLLISNMGIEYYGVWSSIFILYGLASFTDMGLTKAIILEKDIEKKKKVISSVVHLSLVLSVPVVIIGFTVIYYLGYFDDVLTILFLCFAIVFSMNAIGILKAILESNGKITAVNLTSLIQTILLYLASYLSYSLTAEVEIAAIGAALSSVFCMMLGFIFLNKKCKTKIEHLNFKEAIKYSNKGMKISVASIIHTAFQPLVRIFVTDISGSALAGVLDIYLKIANAITSGLNSFSIPLLYRLVNSNRVNKNEKSTINNLLLITIFSTAIVVLFLNVYSETIFPILNLDVEDYLHPIVIIVVCFGIKASVEPISRFMWVEERFLEYNIATIVILIALFLIIFINKMTGGTIFLDQTGISYLISLPYLFSSMSFFLMFKLLR